LTSVLAKLRLFSILTGLSTDYLTRLDQRPYSFKEFMEEWIIDQYLRTLDEFGLKKPGIGTFFSTNSISTIT